MSMVRAEETGFGDMFDSVSITLKGQSIGLSDLSDALAELATMLAEVDQQVTGRRDIDWKVVHLERSSATVGVAPVYRQSQMFDQRAQVIVTFFAGLQALQERPDRPEHFSDKVLASAKRLARYVNGEVAAIIVTGKVENKPMKRVSFGSRMAVHVDEIIGVSGHATGALEGRLETITIHGRNVFTIYDPLRRRGTHCICDAETLDEIRGLLGRRVLVYGDIGYNKGGEPITIRVEQFQLLRTREELPQPPDLRGIFAESAVTASNHADYLRDE